MLPDEITVNFKFLPKLWLFSPFAVLVFIGVWYLPWSAASAPTWVQAVGSVAAIIAAGFFPIWHEKIKQKGELLRLETLIRELALHHQLNLDGLERAMEKGLDQPNSIVHSVVGSRLVHFWPGHLEALQSVDVSKLTAAHLNCVNTMKADVRLILDFLPLLPAWNTFNFEAWVARRVAVKDALEWISQIRKTL